MITLKVVVAWSMDIVLFFDAIVHQAICKFWKIYSKIFQNFSFLISALIVFARFWRILRVINGVIVGTKSDADKRARYLKKKITLLENHEYDNQVFQENLQEAIEENARLNLLRRVNKFTKASPQSLDHWEREIWYIW